MALQDPCYVAQESRRLSTPHGPFQPRTLCPHEVPPPQGPGSASEKPQGKSRVSLNEMTSSSLGRGQGGEDGGPSLPREEPGGLGQTLRESVTTSKRAVSVSVNTSKRTVQKDGKHSGEGGRAPDPPRLSGGGRRRGGPQCSRLVAKCGARAASHPPPRGPGGPALGTSPQPGWTGHGELTRTSQMARTPRSLQDPRDPRDGRGALMTVDGEHLPNAHERGIKMGFLFSRKTK